MKKLHCRICGSNKNIFLYKKNNFNLYRCKNCRIVFVFPHPSNKKIFLINKQKYELESKYSYFNNEKELRERAKKVINNLSKLKKSGKILDIGCSYGFYLSEFKRYGYSVEGIDISKDAVRYIKRILKLKAKCLSYKEFHHNKEKFDIISAFDVIEHIPDPIQFINKISNNLKTNGIVILQTPNYDSLISKITRRDWFWLLIPNHLYIYTIQSIKLLLSKNNFEIIKIETWDDGHEFFRNIIMKLFNHNIKENILYRIVLKSLILLSPPFLYIISKFQKGGEIIIYAKKKQEQL